MTSQQHKNYTLPLAMMFLLFFIISFVTGLQNPLGVIVKEQFSLTNFQSQLGNFANFLAYLIMGIPAGKMIERIGYKKTALVALVMGFTGVLIMFAGGHLKMFYLYLSGAFVSGFTMCTLNAVVNPMITVLGDEKGANQRLNFGGALNSVGATIVPILGGYMMGNAAQKSISDANPLLFLAMGIFALVFIVLYFVQIPEPHIVKKEEKVKNKHSALSFRHFVLGIITIFIYVGIEVGVPNIANLFMTETPTNGGLGIDPTIAGTIVGTYWFLMLIGRLVGGALGKVFSSKQMLTFVSSLGLMLTLAAIYSPLDITVRMPVVTSQLAFEFAEVPINVMFLILIGLCTSIMWPGIFNLATKGIGKYMAQGSGIFMTMVVGGGILPLVQGGIADVAGYLNSYWLIVASLAFMLYYALIGSKNVNTDIPVD